jgi:SPP1 family holin
MERNKINLRGIDSGTIARTAVLVMALLNQVLSAFGKNVIPIEDDDLNALVTSGITVGAALIAWWKNNSVTVNAQTADTYLKALKSGDSDEG